MSTPPFPSAAPSPARPPVEGRPSGPLRGWPKPRVLIVEDDTAQCTVLEYNLRSEGFEVAVVHTGADALSQIERDPPDLVVLDWMIPEVSGLEVCRRLRRRPYGWRIGVIMVSARGDEPDRLSGLEMGADDYLGKPFSMAELLARALAVLRRNPRSEG